MLFSDSAQTLMDTAVWAFKVQDYESALGFAKQATELDPNLQGIQKFIAAYIVQILIERAEWAIQVQDYESALGFAKQAKEHDLNLQRIQNFLATYSVETLIDKAESAFEVQDYESASGFAKEAKELDPNLQGIQKYIDAYFQSSIDKAESAFKVQDYESAFGFASKAKEIDPNFQIQKYIDAYVQTLIDMAESAFKVQDYESALGSANKAKELDPNLQGIENFIAAYSVHVAAYSNNGIRNTFAKRMLNGTEMDWYKILGVSNDSVDIETIKKQYKRMVILVHPDKNNSVAADGAFKLIFDAWTVLSDQSGRMAYDQRSGREINRRTATSSTMPSSSSSPWLWKVSQKAPPRSGTTTATSRARTGGFGSSGRQHANSKDHEFVFTSKGIRFCDEV